MPKAIDIDALFDATVRVFAERGYDAATTQEIASRAGVNEVTLYRRFGSKPALIAAALADILAKAPLASVQATAQVSGDAGGDAGGAARADLAAIVDAYARTNRAYGGAVVTLLAELPRHPELRPALSALMPNLQRAARIVAGHQARGAIGPGDPLQKVVFLLAPVLAEGLWRRAVRGQDADPLSGVAFDPVVVANAFLQGHRPAPEGGRGSPEHAAP